VDAGVVEARPRASVDDPGVDDVLHLGVSGGGDHVVVVAEHGLRHSVAGDEHERAYVNEGGAQRGGVLVVGAPGRDRDGDGIRAARVSKSSSTSSSWNSSNCPLNSCAASRASSAVSRRGRFEFEQRSRFVQRGHRNDLLGHTAGGLVAGQPRHERHRRGEEVKR
jgi:hypothetical protein